jgi:hypothetical protein
MLLGVDPQIPRSLLAEVQELSNLITEFGECSVVETMRPRHAGNTIISHYDIFRITAGPMV